MRIVGLTGSIGMGKSTVARLFRQCGVPVFDADQTVHRLLHPHGAGVAPVLALWPQADDGQGGIDRQKLGQAVFADPAARARLEGILHPLVRQAQARFLRRHRTNRTPVVVLDIPLLFETGSARSCDLTLTVTAPYFLQRQRVLRRPGMTETRFAAILAAQMPDAEKRCRADVVIRNGLSRGATMRQVRQLLERLRSIPQKHFSDLRTAVLLRSAAHVRPVHCAAVLAKPPFSIP
jgi:dephospho-CoA kinase